MSLLRREASALWMIDMQDVLLRATVDWQRILDACIWLAEIGRFLKVPVLVSEQNAKALGPTQADLLTAIGDVPRCDKLTFSCVKAGCFDGCPGNDASQIVLCGIEAHVCILQTALDLLHAGREVFVVDDAVSSRSANDKALAIDRIRQAGGMVVTREMVVFEWLGRAGSDEFRYVSKNYLK